MERASQGGLHASQPRRPLPLPIPLPQLSRKKRCCTDLALERLSLTPTLTPTPILTRNLT